MKRSLLVWLALLMASFSTNAAAQEVLPAPPPPFKGQIGVRASDSTPDFPQPVQAPAGAPNILLVLLDDVGFGASSTFGGPINTGCATTSSTPRRCARRPARRCSPGATITRCIPA